MYVYICVACETSGYGRKVYPEPDLYYARYREAVAYDCYPGYDPDLIVPGRPGSPTVLRLTVPTFAPPPVCVPAAVTTPISRSSSNNLLTVPISTTNCYKEVPPSNYDLSEDIFQEHQAKLVNCDSEDAAASLHRSLGRCDRLSGERSGELSSVPRWLWRSLDALPPVPCEWVPLRNSRMWKSDIYLSRCGDWEFVESSNAAPSLNNYENTEDRFVSSSSEFSYEYSSCSSSSYKSDKSDSSSTESLILTTVKSDDNDNTLVEFDNNKLTPEECKKTIKELDEIVHGISQEDVRENPDESLSPRRNSIVDIPESCEVLAVDEEMDDRGFDEDNEIGKIALKKNRSDFMASMLVDGSDVRRLKYSKKLTKRNSSSDEEIGFEYGHGRVAALAQYFSKLGEKAIIRGRGYTSGAKYKGLVRSQICTSAPNLSVSEPDLEPRAGDIILPPKAFDDNSDCDMVLATDGLRPVGFSMDRLIDLGRGVVMRLEVDNPLFAKYKIINGGETTETEEFNVPTDNSNNNDPITETVGEEQTSRPFRSAVYPDDKESILKKLLSSVSAQDIENEEFKPEFRKTRNSWTQTSLILNDGKAMSLSDSVLHCATQTEKFFRESPALATKTNKAKKMMKSSNKSISVDEVDMKKNSDKKNCLCKHYSLIDLGDVDKLCSDVKSVKVTDKECQKVDSQFYPTEKIHEVYVGNAGRERGSSGRTIKRWMSVDSYRMSGWTDSSRSQPDDNQEKITASTLRDCLRKLHKGDVIKNRKMRRIRKLELQRSFVVTPVRRRVSVSTEEDDSNSQFWCQSLDYHDGQATTQSRKL